MGITGITQEKLAKMQKKSVLSMPNNPSERGMSPNAIKTAMVAPIFDDQNSIVSEINRVVSEINDTFNKEEDVIKNHNELANLDYENSGHTGFARSSDIENLRTIKQDKLINQLNIRSVEGLNLLGVGNISLGNLYRKLSDSYSIEDIDAATNFLMAQINENAEGLTFLQREKASLEDVNIAIENAFEELIGNSPDALNTLKEIADALGNDPNFAATIVNLINEKYNDLNTKITNAQSDYNSKINANKSDYTAKINTLESNTNSKINNKQDKLVSGTNIKSINGQSLLGSGNITIEGGSSGSSSCDDCVTNEEFEEFKESIEQELSQTTATVECTHRYEITGNTGNEHNLAIEDQQMLIKKISGRTLVKNQVYQPVKQGSIWGGAVVSVDTNNIISLSGVSTTSYCSTSNWNSLMDLPHVYFIELNVIENPNNVPLVYGFLNRPGSKTPSVNGVGRSSVIYSQSETNITYGNGEGVDGFAANTDLTGIKYRVRIIDLTLAYGTDNEPTTVEQVLNDFPDHQEYNEGEIIHSNSKLISTGRNLFNQSKELINVGFESIGDGVYFNKGTNTSIMDKELWINKSNYTGQIKIIADYKHTDKIGYLPRIYYQDGTDSFINWYSGINAWSTNVFTSPVNKPVKKIVWSAGSAVDTYVRNIIITTDLSVTIYEHYKEDVIDNIGDLGEWDYIDNASNTLFKNTKIVNLGVLKWEYTGTIFVNYTSNIDLGTTERGADCFCAKYTKSSNLSANNMSDKSIQIMGGSSACNFWIKDTAYTNVNDFKQAMLGVYVAFEIKKGDVYPTDNATGMAVYKNGYQIQEGTIPYNITKQYALSIASQVVQNIEIDREQQEDINELKGQVSGMQELVNDFNGDIGELYNITSDLQEQINNSGGGSSDSTGCIKALPDSYEFGVDLASLLDNYDIQQVTISYDDWTQNGEYIFDWDTFCQNVSALKDNSILTLNADFYGNDRQLLYFDVLSENGDSTKTIEITTLSTYHFAPTTISIVAQNIDSVIYGDNRRCIFTFIINSDAPFLATKNDIDDVKKYVKDLIGDIENGSY